MCVIIQGLSTFEDDSASCS